MFHGKQFHRKIDRMNVSLVLIQKVAIPFKSRFCNVKLLKLMNALIGVFSL